MEGAPPAAGVATGEYWLNTFRLLAAFLGLPARGGAIFGGFGIQVTVFNPAFAFWPSSARLCSFLAWPQETNQRRAPKRRPLVASLDSPPGSGLAVAGTYCSEFASRQVCRSLATEPQGALLPPYPRPRTLSMPLPDYRPARRSMGPRLRRGVATGEYWLNTFRLLAAFLGLPARGEGAGPSQTPKFPPPLHFPTPLAGRLHMVTAPLCRAVVPPAEPPPEAGPHKPRRGTVVPQPHE